MYGGKSANSDAVARAYDDAHTLRRFVGAADGRVDAVSPTQRGEVPVTVEV
jgi:hypothetical protein